jgi:CBS domain-containing protein
MQVHDVMTRDPEVIAPDATLQKAAEMMRSLDVGSLPVVDGDRLAGVVTDRDIAVRGVASGADPKTAKVRDAMTKELVYCNEDQDVGEAARLMRENQVRRLPVLSGDGLLVGVVALADLAVNAPKAEAAAALAGVSEPAAPHRGPLAGLME